MLSGATIRCYQSEPGSDGNEGVLRILQRSSITRTLPSDYLVSHKETNWGRLTLFRNAVGVFCSPSRLGHSLGGLTSQQRCSWCILQPQPTRQKRLGNYFDLFKLLLFLQTFFVQGLIEYEYLMAPSQE